jgi:hypothetical protein
MNMSKERMPSLLDREVRDASEDRFGHRHYAEALKSLIENEEHDPPYSIGLLGKWGTGKSTIKGMYLDNLKDDAETDSEGKKRGDKIHTVTFNAWRYGGSDIKRALLRHVYLELGGDKPSLRDKLFRQIERSEREEKSAWDLVKDIAASLGWPLLLVTLAAVAVAAVVWLVSWRLGAGEVSSGLIGVAAFAFSGYVLRGYIESGLPFVSFDRPVNRIEMPVTTAEEYEDLLLDQIEEFARSEGNECKRLVVFVDDLDRLSATEMVDGLDAIRTFLDLPDHKLPEDLGVIFVISCDEERVARAIERKWRDGDLPGAVFSFEDARRYLNRMFQFRLEIPRFPKRDMRNFAEQKFQNELPEIAKSVEQNGTTLESVVTRLMHVDVESPRNAIQILNAFVQSWWVAQRREHEGPGSGRAGGLREGVVTSHPESLAALSVLRVDFPDFYNELQEQPDLVQQFIQVFVRDENLQQQPDAIRDALSRFSKSEEGEIKEKYKGLQRYLSSLQGIRWPESLRPLLLLTQDPTTRDLGESEIRVREDLISANHQGVLAALGREADDKTFSNGEIEVLHNVVEELHGRESIRQDNAASVIANLAQRIPSDGLGRKLYTFLSGRLQRSGDLRYRLGVSTIRTVLERLRPGECRSIASRLIEDIVKQEGGIDFLTENLETPSLNEAVDIVESATPLILEVYANDGLERSKERRLLEWLTDLRIEVDGEEDEIPFSKLEQWVQEFEESLLPEFGPQYVDMLADYLKAGRSPQFELGEALRKSKDVFEQMIDRGTESRKKLGEVLTKLVSVEEKSAVKRAYEFVRESVRQFDGTTVDNFIQSFANRLQKRDTEEGWEISDDWTEDIDVLLYLVDARSDDIQGVTAQEALEDLATVLGRATSNEEDAEQKAHYATQILERLLGIAPKQANRAIGNWMDRVLGGLPVTARKWIGTNVQRISSENRSELTRHLNNHVRDTNITEETAEKYRELTLQITQEGANTEEMQNHLGNVYQYLQNNHNNQNLVERVFPALPHLLEYGPKDRAGQMINQLFRQSRNSRPLHGVLHENMADHWLKEESDYANYQPGAYFNYGEEYVTQYQSDDKAPDVLYSMRQMAEKGLVERRNYQSLVDAACSLWGHDKNTALEVIREFEVLPQQIGEIADLLDSIDPDSEEEVDTLEEAWNAFSERTSEDEDFRVMELLLNKSAKGSSGRPDVGLQLWAGATGVSEADVLRRTALYEPLNDEQRKRVWLQIERAAQELGENFFLDLLPDYFELSDTRQAQREALSEESKSEISSLFQTREGQQQLARILLEALERAGRKGLKRKLATWIGELQAPSSLIHEQELTNEEQKLLEENVSRYEVE